VGGDGRHGLEGIALLCSQAGPQGTVELDRGERAVKGICLLLELLHPGREISQGFSGSAFDLEEGTVYREEMVRGRADTDNLAQVIATEGAIPGLLAKRGIVLDEVVAGLDQLLGKGVLERVEEGPISLAAGVDSAQRLLQPLDEGQYGDGPGSARFLFYRHEFWC
jgi:hypothetical protein